MKLKKAVLSVLGRDGLKAIISTIWKSKAQIVAVMSPCGRHCQALVVLSRK